MYVLVSFLRKLLKHYSRAGDVQDQTHHQELARCGGHQWAQCHYCIPSWQEKWTVNVNKWARSGIWTSLVEALKHLEIYTDNIYIYKYILQSITIAHTHTYWHNGKRCKKHHWTARLYLDVLDYVWTNSRLNRRSTEAISAPGRKRLIRKEQFSTNRASDLNRMAITQEHNYHWWSATPDPINISCMSCMHRHSYTYNGI